MFKYLAPTLLSSLFLFHSCMESSDKKDETSIVIADNIDQHTHAKPDEAKVTHLNWRAQIDFEEKKIVAETKWKIEKDSLADSIIFDIHNLKINSVRVGGIERRDYYLGAADPILGQPLVIFIDSSTQWVAISYETNDGADALQWLDPQQTKGKSHPFLYTQSQAILARTWLPCQDSPGIKFTYTASVSVPNDLMAVMSATNGVGKNEKGNYQFAMKQPIPSYLMALAVGNLEFRKMSDRTGVYAEPEVIEAAVLEFEETDEMMKIAESFFGPYQWERYDILVLPPSFPFGGMENPRLTFVTPTIIAGDKSLTALIAHELAHSWSGNLVTNATWNDFWLNEGFTVYLERRIMDSLRGSDFNDMLAVLGYQDLEYDLARLPKEETSLYLDLAGRNPDDGMTDIAYEKGALFLTYLEENVGRKNMDQFLTDYFKQNSFSSITTANFLEQLDTIMFKGDSNRMKKLRIDRWVYRAGLPGEHIEPTSSEIQYVRSTMKAWSDKAFSFDELETSDWNALQWIDFLRRLPDTLSAERYQRLDMIFKFSQSPNNEIKAIWFERSIQAGYIGVKDELKAFLMEVGRRKFLYPIYEAMLSNDEYNSLARSIYKDARKNYHSVSRKSIDQLMDKD
ncbi:MAG TPA: aminopeptidase [Flavobacteriales bacterium]|jgi:leukotriene-A4 hydrolase|nr:aminopeptidase [Flavobacteriales bacterium]